MEKIKDYSYGFIPVLKRGDGELLFLIVQGRRGQAWGFPKGHAEGNEDAEAAARRELKEETGITEIKIVDSLSYSESYETIKGGHLLDKTVQFFVCFVEKSEVTIQEKEISDYKWATYDEAMRLFVFENHKSVLTRAVEDLKNAN